MNKGLSLPVVCRILDAVSNKDTENIPFVTQRGEVVTGVKVVPGLVILCTEME